MDWNVDDDDGTSQIQSLSNVQLISRSSHLISNHFLISSQASKAGKQENAGWELIFFCFSLGNREEDNGIIFMSHDPQRSPLDFFCVNQYGFLQFPMENWSLKLAI